MSINNSSNFSLKRREKPLKNNGNSLNLRNYKPIVFTDLRPKALVIDDDNLSAELISFQLNKLGYATQIANFYSDGFQYLLKSWDLVVMDWILDKNTGGELAHNIEHLLSSTTVSKKNTLITYSSLEIEHIRLNKLNHFNYIGHVKKPFHRKDLIKLLKPIKIV